MLEAAESSRHDGVARPRGKTEETERHPQTMREPWLLTSSPPLPCPSPPLLSNLVNWNTPRPYPLRPPAQPQPRPTNPSIQRPFKRPTKPSPTLPCTHHTTLHPYTLLTPPFTSNPQPTRAPCPPHPPLRPSSGHLGKISILARPLVHCRSGRVIHRALPWTTSSITHVHMHAKTAPCPLDLNGCSLLVNHPPKPAER